MTPLNLQRHAHRRLNLLTGEWTLVSPGRTARPWQGQVESLPAADTPAHDPACYMCPGNRRANGEPNPDYTSTFVFDNDFPALAADETEDADGTSDLLVARPTSGHCRVVCFSPRHDLTLARMPVDDVFSVVDCWSRELRDLESRPEVAHVQIFENRGAMMGASNPHPHGQIWATSFVPDEIVKEQAAQAAYFGRHGRELLADYADLEETAGERLVLSNRHFACVVPFWAVWPFETLIVAKGPIGSLADLDDAGRRALAAILRDITSTYDRLFSTPFPYTMGFHLRPPRHDGSFRLHAHFYPPLLRSATVRKFMVGFEMLALPQRDLTPEEAADTLRRVAAHG